MTGNSSPHIGRRGFMAGSAGLGLLLATGGLPALAQAQRAGTLKMGTLGLDTADPHRHTGSIGVQQAYVEALTSIAGDGSVEPWLAESFAFSPDGLTYTFKLRPGVKFHNGDTLKAADVVANIERVKTQIKGGWLVTAMKKVAKVEAPDDATVVLTMSESYAPLLNLMSELWILSPKSTGWGETVSLPIGTGPFTFGSWQPKVSFTAPAFPDYWAKGLPLVEAVTFDLRDTEDKVLPLQAGDLHIIQIQGLESAQTVQGSGVAEVMPLKDSSWLSIAWNNRSPKAPFDDVRVRQALVMALDRKKMSQALTNGLAKPASNPYGDGSWVKCKDDGALPYDVEKAKALIKDYGKPVEFKKLFTATPRGRAAGQVEQQLWKQIGANMEMEQVDQATFPARGFTRQFQVIGWRIIDLADPDVQMYANFHTGSPANLAQYSNPELDGLLQKARTTADTDKRIDLYCQITRLINKEAIWYWSFQNTYYAISTAKVKGLPKMYSGVIDVSRTWKE